MESVGRFVGGLQIKLKVDAVTSDRDDDAPQIYMLDEVVSMAGSRADTVRAATEAIVRRLQHRSPVVKQKALRLVKHAASRGSGELRTALAQQSSLLRELTSFRCEPDPFKGDVVWRRVQEYAREALAAVHSAGHESQGYGMQQQSNSSLRGRIQGFGSDAGSGRSGMMGFGSDSLGSGGGSSSSSSGMVGFGSDTYPGQPAYSSRGGSSYSQPAAGSYTPPEAAFGGGGFAPLSSPANGSGASTQQASLGSAHPAERRLVDRLCTPAGLRAAPEQSDLKAFVDGLAPLSGSAAAQLLQEKLERGPWQATLRALHAIQAAAQSSSSSAACADLVVHFKAAPDGVRRAAASAQATVRQQAQRALAAIGEGSPGAAAAGASPAKQAAPQAAAAIDLLGGLEEAAPQASDGSAADAADLLAGLDLGPQAGQAGSTGGSAPAAAAAVAAPASPVDLLAQLDFGGPTATAANGGTSSGPAALSADLFGGDFGLLQSPPATTLSTAAAVPAPAPAPSHAAAMPPAAAASSPAGGLDDLLGGLGPSAISAHPQLPALDMFAPVQQQQLQQQPLNLFGGLAPPPQQPLGSGLPSYQQPAATYRPQQQQQPAGLVGDLLAPMHTGYTSTLPPPQSLAHGPAMRTPSGSLPALGDLSAAKGGQGSFSFISEHISQVRQTKK